MLPISVIKSKEKIIYEIAISLGLDPDDLSNLPTPSIDDPRYNLFVVLKNNLNILDKMKEI